MPRDPHRQPSFNTFFRSRLLPLLERFENTRRRRLPFLISLVFLLVAVIFACIVLYFRVATVVFVILSILSMAGAVLGAIWRFLIPSPFFVGSSAQLLSGPMRVLAAVLPVKTVEAIADQIVLLDNLVFHNAERRNTFSQEIVARTVNHVLPGLTIRPVEYLGQGDYLESMLFGANITRYTGRDYFYGKLNGFDIRFSWLKTGYRAAGVRDQHFRQLFNGWFFVVAFGREFAGTTLIYPDIAEASLGWLGRSLQEIAAPSWLDLIHLEDADFEARFKTLSSSQLDSRYILSPRFMRVSTAVHKRLGGGLALSFRGNRMYAAFPGVCEHFVNLPTRPFTDPAFTRHLFHAVTGVRELTAEIEKNHRLWARDVIEFAV